jgi:hypothetical protein
MVGDRSSNLHVHLSVGSGPNTILDDELTAKLQTAAGTNMTMIEKNSLLLHTMILNIPCWPFEWWL